MHHILFSGFGYEVHAAPVLAGLSGLAAFLYLRGRAPAAGLGEDDFWTLMVSLVFGVLGGAVLFYAAAYGRGLLDGVSYLAANRKVQGGSFWGSYWLAAALAWLYCRLAKKSAGAVLDAVGLSALLALALMRVGCLLNGCCHGTPTALPWGVVFSDPGCGVRRELLGVPLHPAQLYEAAGSLAIFLYGHFRLLKPARLAPGAVFALATAAYSALRFFNDFVRGGEPGNVTAAGLTTAQLIALASAAGSLAWWFARGRRR